MNIPHTILFDLDNTLTDHTASSKRALHDLYREYESTCFSGIEYDDFFRQFTAINKKFWQQYVDGEIGVATLRHERMNILLKTTAEQTGQAHEAMPDFRVLSDHYLNRYITHSRTYEGVPTLLKELYGRHRLAIITNGFSDIQQEKLRVTAIRNYFDLVISSEDLGIHKPDPAIFHHTLQQIDAVAEDAIYIGDNFFHDICGAARAGLKTIWYNSDAMEHPADHPHVTPDAVARSIPELSRLLRCSQSNTQNNAK